MRDDFERDHAPHLAPRSSVGGVMRQVLLALVPAAIVHVYFFGIGLLLNILVCTSVALAAEAAMLRTRGQPVRRFLADWSAPVTAVLIAFALPPLTPWWVSASAALFAIVVAKHLYGGLGYNPFNPAMVGYAVALVAFPAYMTGFPPPRGLADPAAMAGVGETLRYALTASLPSPLSYDSVTMATPLDYMQSELGQMRMVGEIHDAPVLRGIAGVGWDWVSVALIIGGGWLLARRIIRWQIPVGVLLGLTASALLLHWLAPDNNASAAFHLMGGATMLTAFFIATDPVSAATTPRGRLVYGAGIGIIAMLIRAWGKYPDGFAFAVLLMNVCAPLIDRFTAPRVYGHER